LIDRQRSGSRLIDTPIETILPESWFVDDKNFYFPDMPADIEVQVDYLKRAWDEKTPKLKKKKHRNHKKKKNKFKQKSAKKKKTKDQTWQNAIVKPEAKDHLLYHKYLEEYHSSVTTTKPNEIEQYSGGHKIVISLPSDVGGNKTKSADFVSTYLFPELMKENGSNVAIYNDLTNQTNKASSIIINEIDVFKDSLEFIEDIPYMNDKEELDKELNNDMVHLEIAMLDSANSNNIDTGFDHSIDENTTRDAFLPFVTNREIMYNDMFYEDVVDEDIKFDKNEVDNKFVREEGHQVLNSIDSTTSVMIFSIKKEPWVFPILILGSTSVCVFLTYQVLVLCRIIKPVSSLGQPLVEHVLIVGLILCSATSLIYTLTSSKLSCAIIRFASGLSYSTVYAAMLVKFVFLTFLGSGIYLPPVYQSLLLFLALLIQIVIGIQWLVAVPPEAIPRPEGGLCGTSFEQQLHGHVYNIFIVAFLVFLNLRFGFVRSKYREARFIGFIALVSGPLWVCWVLAGLSIPTNYQELCSASGLLVTSFGTFIMLLIAKYMDRSSKKLNSSSGTIYRSHDQNTLTTFSICPNIDTRQVLCPCLKIFNRPGTSSRTSLVSVEHKSQQFFRASNESIGTVLPKSEDTTEGSEEDDSSHTYSPEHGYRITNSFDRFPFMSRPLHSTLGNTRPASSLIYSGTEDTNVKQSVSNPNVLFCTPEDMRVLRYEKLL